MSPRLIVPFIAATALVFSGGAEAQVANPDFKISKIAPEAVDSPTGGQKRVSRPKKWLAIDVTFDWQPRLPDPKYLDDLTVTYYVLLNNGAVNADRKPTLLVGSVPHVSIPQGKDLHSVIYVSPRTLERFFGGNAPGNPTGAVFDVGVTLSQGGQVVAESSLKGKGAWWPQYAQTPGYLMNKNETPFMADSWDYYETIKKPAGN